MSKKTLAVFISGQGTNLEILLQNKEAFKSIWVISSEEDAYGLERAKNHGVRSYVLNKKKLDWRALNTKLQSLGVEVIFLAGFMKILPPEFIEPWEGCLFNLHPSLLPEFKGLKAMERAFAEKADIGASIHHVLAEVDAGEVVFQGLAVKGDELGKMTLDEVREKTQAVEHKLVQKWIDQWGELADS